MTQKLASVGLKLRIRRPFSDWQRLANYMDKWDNNHLHAMQCTASDEEECLCFEVHFNTYF